MADSEKPDGLIVTDDILCLGAAKAIQEFRINVPRQIRVVTQGNKDSGIRYPFPVSVLESDAEEYAAAMVELMVRQLRREPLERSVITLPFHWTEQEENTAVKGLNALSGVRFFEEAENQKGEHEEATRVDGECCVRDFANSNSVVWSQHVRLERRDGPELEPGEQLEPLGQSGR